MTPTLWSPRVKFDSSAPTSSPFYDEIISTLCSLQRVESTKSELSKAEHLSHEQHKVVGASYMDLSETNYLHARFQPKLELLEDLLEQVRRRARAIELDQTELRTMAKSKGIDVDHAIATGAPCWKTYLASGASVASEGSRAGAGPEETVLKKPYHDVLMLVYKVEAALTSEMEEAGARCLGDDHTAVDTVKELANKLIAQESSLKARIERQEQSLNQLNRNRGGKRKSFAEAKDRFSRHVVELVLHWKHQKEEEESRGKRMV
ncbi:uncharacterized protein JCM6883_005824 [Sporobolomyces salmoneus]|uniref:uncharacterized protein n=1 Tax=Sporobolomyces salmoneus TaxID=183962 RepID=UPI00317B5E5A